MRIVKNYPAIRMVGILENALFNLHFHMANGASNQRIEDIFLDLAIAYLNLTPRE